MPKKKDVFAELFNNLKEDFTDGFGAPRWYERVWAKAKQWFIKELQEWK